MTPTAQVPYAIGLIKAADWAAQQRAKDVLASAQAIARDQIAQAEQYCAELYAETRRAAHAAALADLDAERVALLALRSGLWRGLQKTLCEQVIVLVRGLCQGAANKALWKSALKQLASEFPAAEEVALAVHPDMLDRARASSNDLAGGVVPFQIEWIVDPALGPLQCKCTWQQRTVVLDFEAAIARLAQEMRT